MQLLRLEMKGFKSFADKTIIHFSPGMTAVVGPNGSGKSNITDAVRWVLGESNVRQLRGQKAEDIIFSGTEKRRPMSAAEVTLVFDNTDGQWADGLAEVSVTRRMYRTGESDFYINKRSCRLKDIHLLFADTGLGRDSMAIIGQNRVDAILNSKPEERRVIFEDVAGISRFKMNKEEAQRKITATERNMERVSDMIAGVEEQLGPAEEKAAATRQYQAWAQEKRMYEGVIGFHDYKTADRLYTKVENEHIALSQEEVELSTDIAALDAKRATSQQQIDAWEVAMEADATAFQEAQQGVERSKGALALVEEKLRAKTEELERLENEREGLQAQIQADSQQIQLWQALLAEDTETMQGLMDSRDKAQTQYEKATQAVKDQEAVFTALQEKVSQQHQAEMDRLRQQEAWAAEERRLEDVLTEAKAALGALALEWQTVQSDVDRLTVQCQDMKAKETEVQSSLEEAKTRLQHHEQLVAKGQGEENQYRRQWQELEGRCQILQQWASEYEGYGQGTKKILQAKASWRSGVRGAIGDLFTVDEPYTTAIEVALGGAIHNIVTTTAQVAAAGVSYLKETKGGRITFLPQDTVQGKRLQSPALQEDGVIGLAVDCIQFDDAYTGIFLQLLGRVLLVKTMDEAIRLQKKYKQQLYIVTLGGEQFRPGGSLTGGFAPKKQASVLARKEELRQCEAKLDTVKATWQSMVVARQEAEASLQADKQAVTSLQSSWQESHLAYVSLAAQLDNAKERLQRKIDAKQEWIHKEEDANKGLADIAVARGAVETTTVTKNDAMEAQQEAYRLLQTLQGKQQQAQEAFNALNLQVSQRQQQRDTQEEQCKDKEKYLQSGKEKLGTLEVSLGAIREEVHTILPAEQAGWVEKVSQAEEAVASLESARRGAFERLRKERQQLTSYMDERQECEKRYAVVQQKLGDTKGRLSEYRMKGEQALEFLASIGYTREDAQKLHVPGGIADWKSMKAQLEGQMESLGPINPQAIVEFEELQERCQFLQTQQGDMEAARHQLSLVIAELDAAMASQLQDVLGIVAKRFQEIFSQLFGGGTAQIVCTGDDDILTGGIDFYIQPPGKKRQQLSLLSGGERALTVIALLFSFLDYRPAPFCILDEVDAALDEANVERFSRYLHTLGTETQFVVVSHRKKTMEAAQVLQGVTMMEQGVSKILTVDFDEYEEDA